MPPEMCSPFHVARSLLGAAVLIASVTWPSAANAEPSASDKAMADALFREAKALAVQNRFGEACPKIAEAQRLDPAPGAGLVLGDCYERVGKLASAWGAFNETIAIARNARDEERRVEAARRAGLLEGRLPKVALVVSPLVRVPGLEIRWDGKPIGDAAWSSAIPADPGGHMIEAGAPGRKAWSMQVTVPGSGTINVTIPVLDEAADTPGGGTLVPFWGPQRIGGLVTGSVGVAGLLIGAAAGGLTLAKTSESEPYCTKVGGSTQCDPTGLALRDQAKTLAKVSDVALAIGGVAAIVGVVVFATAPKPKSTSSGSFRVHVGPGNVGVLGVW